MNARLVKFSLASLCMHVAVFASFWHVGSFESGVASGMEREQPELKIRIVEAENMRRQAAIQEPLKKELIPNRNPSIAEIEKIFFHPSLRAPERLGFISPSGSPVKTDNMNEPVETKAEAVAMEDYVAAGRLTRPPAPLADIDLNVPGINELAFAGKTELTVLINSNGLVVDVVIASETGAARAFGERVAEHFRTVRFRPGEISGKAVNSQLQITVVSESLTRSRDQN